MGVRDQFRLGGLRSVAWIFSPLLARKSSGFVRILHYFLPEYGYVKNSRGVCSPPPPPPRTPMNVCMYVCAYVCVLSHKEVKSEASVKHRRDFQSSQYTRQQTHNAMSRLGHEPTQNTHSRCSRRNNTIESMYTIWVLFHHTSEIFLNNRGYHLKTDIDPIAMVTRIEIFTHKPSETNTNSQCMVTHARLC